MKKVLKFGGIAIAVAFVLIMAIGLYVQRREASDPAYAEANRQERAQREKELQDSLKGIEAKARERESKRFEDELKSESAVRAAIQASREYVRPRLKSPASAEFASLADSNAKHLGAGVFTVASYVDAPNSFGAKLRTRYIARLKTTDLKAWELVDLQIEGEKAK
jgi:hypothetical protein